MVYNLPPVGEHHQQVGSTRQQGAAGGKLRFPKIRIKTESWLAKVLVGAIRLLLFLYDTLTLPIYYLLQRPYKRARLRQQIRSEQVDANTWIRTNHSAASPTYGELLINLSNGGGGASNGPVSCKSNGTLSDMFARAVALHSARSCLGYRAVVSCPFLVHDDGGQHVVRERSFRSDYTWYTYNQIGHRVHDIASGLYYLSAVPATTATKNNTAQKSGQSLPCKGRRVLEPNSRALFLATASLEWFCAAQACHQLALQLVLAPQISDPQALQQVVRECSVETVFVSCDKLPLLCALLEELSSADAPNQRAEEDSPTDAFIERIIIIDWQFSIDFEERIFQQLGCTLTKSNNNRAIHHQKCSVLSIGQVEEAGIEFPIKLPCSRSLRDECALTIDDQQPVVATDGREDSGTSRSVSGSGGGESLAARTAAGASSSGGGGVDHGAAYSSKANVQTGGGSSTTGCWAKPTDVALIVYTHGPLGRLRSVSLSHSYLTRTCQRLSLNKLVGGGGGGGSETHCATLPLDNLIEFTCELCVFSEGGSIGYSCSLNTLFYDGTELFERDLSDLEALKPSFLLVQPFILERLRSSVQNYLQINMNPIKSFIMKSVLFEYKKYWAKRHYSTPIVDRLFCSSLRRLFGGRQLRYILCNGITDCTETKDFFALMVGVPIVELYGPGPEAIVSLISINDMHQCKYRYKRRRRRLRGPTTSLHNRALLPDETELSDNEEEDEVEDEDDCEDLPNLRLMPPMVNRNNSFRVNSCKNLLITSSILTPAVGARIRLENWEDFRSTDLPYPRGRLVIGGEVVCSPTCSGSGGGGDGASRDSNNAEEAACCSEPQQRQLLYSDSNNVTWFRTQEIARVFPNGTFEIISGMSRMIRMFDGQLISLSQIEYITRNSQFVDNVCAICCNDTKRSVVIILVVPNLQKIALKSPGEANLKLAIGSEPEPEELLDVEFRREVCNDRLLCEFVNRHLRQLLATAGFHSINIRFLLVPEIWSPEMDLVTPNYEPKPSAIQKFYATDIQSIFELGASGLLFSSSSGNQYLSARRRHMVTR